MAPVATAVPMTKLSLVFMLSLLRDEPMVDVPSVHKHHWAYKGMEGPENWPAHYPKCAGQRQSPINIEARSCVYDSSLTEFNLINFNRTSGSVEVGCQLNFTNNGHSASVRVTSDMAVEGGGLVGRYRTAEFHFHWGDMDEAGSEHAVDGVKYPMEMHVVSYAEKYGTLMAAMEKPDGLAVFGVFFQVSEQDNPVFAPLADTLQYIHKAGEHRTVDGVQLRSLLPEDTSRFWRYSGSLTTPRCYESVTWTVFEEPQKISVKQLSQLRHLLYEEGHETHDHSAEHHGHGGHGSNKPSFLVNNWRPLQPSHGRTVRSSFPVPGAGQSAGAAPSAPLPEGKLVKGANVQPTPEVATENAMNESHSSLTVTPSPEVTKDSSTPAPAKEEQPGSRTTTAANKNSSTNPTSLPPIQPESLAVSDSPLPAAGSPSIPPELNTLSFLEVPVDKIGIPPSLLNGGDGPVNTAMERPYILSSANQLHARAGVVQSTSQLKLDEPQTSNGDSRNSLSPSATSIASSAPLSAATVSDVTAAPATRPQGAVSVTSPYFATSPYVVTSPYAGPNEIGRVPQQSSREARLQELSQRLRQFVPQEGYLIQTGGPWQDGASLTSVAGRARGDVTDLPQLGARPLYSNNRNNDNALLPVRRPPPSYLILAPPQQQNGWDSAGGRPTSYTVNHLMQSLRSNLYVRPGATTDSRLGTSTHSNLPSAAGAANLNSLLHRGYVVVSPAVGQVSSAAGDGTFNAPFLFLHKFDQPVRIRSRFYGNLNSQLTGLY